MHLYTGSNSPRFSPLGLNLNCEFFSQSPSFAWCNIIASQLLRTYITQPSWLDDTTVCWQSLHRMLITRTNHAASCRYSTYKSWSKCRFASSTDPSMYTQLAQAKLLLVRTNTPQRYDRRPPDLLISKIGR